MHTGLTPWLSVHQRMILPHASTHTAEQNKAKCNEGSAMLGIDETMHLAVCQNTTASSLNAYDDTPNVSQLRCNGQTFELFHSMLLKKQL